jgi:hypothetical protein
MQQHILSLNRGFYDMAYDIGISESALRRFMKNQRNKPEIIEKIADWLATNPEPKRDYTLSNSKVAKMLGYSYSVILNVGSRAEFAKYRNEGNGRYVNCPEVIELFKKHLVNIRIRNAYNGKRERSFEPILLQG